MGTLHSSPETLAMAKRVRKAWAKQRYTTYSALANAFNIQPGQARRIVLNEILKGGDTWPDGNWRKFTYLDKRFVVYDDGRVWSITSNRFIGGTHKSGYKVIKVYDNATKIVQTVRISRMVLEVFDRPPKEGEEARHLDDDRTNNRLSNLAWGSHDDNAKDMLRNGLSAKGEKHPGAKLTDKIVLRILKEYDGTGFRPFARAFIAENILDVELLAVLRVLRGKTWTHVTEVQLPKKVIRAMHRNWMKYTKPRHVFCVKYADFLVRNGYPLVRPYHVYCALIGKRWRGIYDEFN